MSLNITRLRHIALKTSEPEKAARFYEDLWGLKIVAQQQGGYYLRGVLPENFILAILPAEHRGIEHIAFALPDRVAVESAAQELASKGVNIFQPPVTLNTPGGGYGFQILDPDGRCLEFSCEVAEAAEMEWEAWVRPNKISHVVLNTPDFENITRFYTEVLGFRITDWSEQQMVFLRCNSDHHSIAFNRAPHASLNHVAYELPSVDQVMRGIGNLSRHGVTRLWGPGRHGPGDNVFCYFQDAAGYVCEYTAEVMTIDEATHQPQVWPRNIPEKMDRWGFSGPPTPEARAAMAGEPDIRG